MKLAIFFSVYLLLFTAVQAQDLPFYNEIQIFKKSDSAKLPAKNAILFVGSSSFNYWKDVQQYFPEYTIINRGFGGSSLPDVIQYADEIIFPYHPKQVVVYCGENDLAGSDTITPETVYHRFKILFEMIRNKLPESKVTFVSLKPSPSRAYLKEKVMKANRLINDYLASKPNSSFVNVYSLMLNENGKPYPHIFVQDSLHMNANGYAIWQKAIKPHLLQ